MSGFLSSRYLKHRQPRPERPIDLDLSCPGCGYNLRGLKEGKRCPECGLAVEARRDEGDPLLAGGWSGPRKMRAGLAIAFLCLVMAVAARLVLFVGGVARIGTGLAGGYLLAGLVLSAAWTVAALLLTPPRLDRHWSWMRPVRRVIRVSQPLWVAGYLCWLMGAGNSSDLLIDAGRVLRLVAGVGAVMLAFVLCRIARTVEREDAARRLNAAVWLLPIATLLPQLFRGSVAWFTLIPFFLLLLLWAWTMTLFARGVLELQRHVSWSMIHAAESRMRDQRVAETRAAADSEIEASIRPVPPPLPDIPLEPPADPPGE